MSGFGLLPCRIAGGPTGVFPALENHSFEQERRITVKGTCRVYAHKDSRNEKIAYLVLRHKAVIGGFKPLRPFMGVVT